VVGDAPLLAPVMMMRVGAGDAIVLQLQSVGVGQNNGGDLSILVVKR
jgi:hypothetical protein